MILRLAEFNIHEVIKSAMEDPDADRFTAIDLNGNGHSVRLRPRYFVYHLKGISCVTCGRTATHAFLECVDVNGRRPNKPNINFYFAEDGPYTLMTIDHHNPKSRGGTDDIDNLFPMCSPCNFKKANSVPASE